MLTSKCYRNEQSSRCTAREFMQNDQQSIFNSLQNEGPRAWLSYLRPFEKGEPITGLSMDVVYHHAAPLAKNQSSLDWAQVAIIAANLWARNSSGVERENALLWAMKLRSWFISKMGSRPNHPVLDKQIILSWVTDGLSLPAKSAEHKAATFWENMAKAKSSTNPEDIQKMVDDLHTLRQIKHRLNVAKVLADCGELSDNPVVSEWLKLRERLP